MGSRKIYISTVFSKKLKKIKKQQKQELDDVVIDLLKGPSIGEEKIGDLAGIFVHKFKINKQQILLSYTYNQAEINLLTFGSHENFYRDLKAYRKA